MSVGTFSARPTESEPKAFVPAGGASPEPTPQGAGVGPEAPATADAMLLEHLYARIMRLPERSAQRARLEERARVIRHRGVIE